VRSQRVGFVSKFWTIAKLSFGLVFVHHLLVMESLSQGRGVVIRNERVLGGIWRLDLFPR
jgi:hypothetical protein